MKNIPFYIDGVRGGFMRVEGIIRLEKKGLYLEFQIKDAVVKAYKSSIKTLFLALEDIDTIKIKVGWFRTRLWIHVQSGIMLEAIPGNDLTQRVFSFKRMHRLALANMVSQFNLAISEIKLKELDQKYRTS
tara:strand:- start:3739 stop:4131 length:393 start_codon:yes stop_codon:yes gene_type:complete